MRIPDMVMTALAWNLKSWYGLLMPNRERGMELVKTELVKMEFRRFLNAIMLIPLPDCADGAASDLPGAGVQ